MHNNYKAETKDEAEMLHSVNVNEQSKYMISKERAKYKEELQKK